MKYKKEDIVYVRRDAIKIMNSIEKYNHNSDGWMKFIGKMCKISHVLSYPGDRNIYFIENGNGFYEECLGYTQIEEMLDIESVL